MLSGSSFVICDGAGDIHADDSQGYGSHGFYAGDTRLVSRLALGVSGVIPRLLDQRATAGSLTSTCVVGDPTRPELLITRRTILTDRLIVSIQVRNLTSDETSTILDLTVQADFADLFDVKRGVAPRAGFVGAGPIDGALLLTYESGDFHRSVRVACSTDCDILRDGLRIDLTIGARDVADVAIEFLPQSTPGTPLATSASAPLDVDEWERELPDLIAAPSGLTATWRRATSDIASLLLAGPDGNPIVAAGFPWFMALFGRDSLITSCSTVMLGTRLGRGTLGALAQLQGTGHVPESAEQPGRILHELRSGEVVLRPGGWGAAYYGSVDATPLFVIALGELWRWGAPASEVEALLPAAERAIAWVQGDGDPDGDGLVEYGGATPQGVASLANQGWKDSHDAVRHRDGSLAEGPIAMVEVQGYCHAAYLALADLREAFGTDDPAPLRQRADQLAEQIDALYWMDDEDCFALALDGAKRQVGAVSTNAGHLLWTGTATDGHAARLVDRLMAHDMYTGFGLRTLTSTNPGYNALSYHCGSVWPHDSAMVAAGMIASGHRSAGATLAMGILEAAEYFGGRPPELFAGFGREEFRHPVPYPTSCSPQAWAAGSTIMLVQAMLGLKPDVPRCSAVLDPCLPGGVTLELDRIRLGESDLYVCANGASGRTVPRDRSDRHHHAGGPIRRLRLGSLRLSDRPRARVRPCSSSTGRRCPSGELRCTAGPACDHPNRSGNANHRAGPTRCHRSSCGSIAWLRPSAPAPCSPSGRRSLRRCLRPHRARSRCP